MNCLIGLLNLDQDDPENEKDNSVVLKFSNGFLHSNGELLPNIERRGQLLWHQL